MSINKNISSKNALIQAKEQMGLEGTTRFDGLFKIWIRNCYDRIGHVDGVLKPKVLCATVEDCKIDLPCEAVAMHPGVFLQEINCDDCFKFISYADRMLQNLQLTTRGVLRYAFFYEGTQYQVSIRDYGIQDNKVVFGNSSYNGRQVWIIYLALETDDEGFIMVPQPYIDAMIEFITLKMAERSRFTNQYRLTRGELIDMRTEYHRLVRNARAESGFTSPEGHERIKNLINSYYSGTGHIDWLLNYSPVYV